MSDNQQKMAQMAQMMQQMAGGEKPDTSRISQIIDGEIHTWGDGRMTGRFNKPHPDSLDQKTGLDPFKKILHSTRGKKTPLDMDAIQTALVQPGIYDSNFYPLHDIIAHPHWTDAEKVAVLNKCLVFGPDVNQRNQNLETPLQYALRIQNPELAGIAAMSLMERGADLNVLDKDGRKALHHVLDSGHPELIPAMIARGATPGKTASGVSLSQIALDKFTRTMTVNVSNDPQIFETALTAYYKSMAYVKAYKLHEGAFSMEEHRKKLLDVCKKQPGHRTFIDNVEKKIAAVEPIKTEHLRKAQVSRPYTNPGHGFNYKIEETGPHPWLSGFTAFMNKVGANLERDAYFIRSNTAMKELLNKPELINKDYIVDHLRGQRNKIDIDYVVMDNKINPNGDTFLTKLARTGNFAGISSMVDMNANLNAQDFKGNTAMHLLVENCQNKEELLVGLKSLVGVPSADGKSITTLGGGTNYADRDIVNARGQTFMDVLLEKNPEWARECSIALGAGYLQPIIRPLEISRILMLEGPEGMLRLDKNPDPYLLMDETIPKLQPLSSVATEGECNDHVESVAQALIKIQVLKTTASPEKVQELNGGAEDILNNQSAETKMRTCILFAQDNDPDSHKINAQAMLLHSLSHTMRNGTDAERGMIFDTFEKVDQELQFRTTALFKAQSVTIAGEASKLGEEDQPKFNTAISSLQTAATLFESNIASYAQAKYQIPDYTVDNTTKPNSDKP